MKKIVAMICLFVMIIVSSTGCVLFTKQGAEYAAGAVNIKLESELIKTQYIKVFNMVSTNQAKFTQDEWNSLMDVHFSFSETYARLETMFSKPEKLITPQELRKTYELAFIGYSQAREIVGNHKDGFTKFQWAQLINFDEQVAVYDKQVRAVLDNPDTEDINVTLGIIITLSTVAYKYLLPVVMSAI